MKKELKDYLHLYFKCWGEVSKSKSEEYSNGKWALSAKILHEAMMGNLKFKPILRPLSDMTEDELQECGNMVYDFSDDNSGLGLNEHEWEHFTTLLCSEQFHWLLLKHFDLFGLIEAGLAIDKTKLNEKV